jgi:excinuclease ABC subunit C
MKSEYRTFKVKTTRNDDFGSMYEVLSRRFRRSKTAETNDQKTGWAVPDLLVIDGGKGQLGSALAALRDAQIDTGAMGVDVVGLAKEREDAEGTKQPDRVFLAKAKDPIKLRANSSELFLLARVRDEAHRFAITFHRKLRRGRTLHSTLDDVPGIGERRKRELLKHFGSVKGVREATIDALARAPGMTRKAAEQLAAFFADAAPSATSSGAPDPLGEAELNAGELSAEEAGERDDVLFDDAASQLETLAVAEESLSAEEEDLDRALSSALAEDGRE